jgi:alpha-D-xyloside xylohydrolase
MKYLLVVIGFMLLNSVSGQQLTWEKKYNGIWKAVVGKPEKVGLLNSVNNTPAINGLDKLPAVEFPLKATEIHATIVDGKVYLRFPLERDEQLFGLGLNFQTVNQRGRILNLHMDHYGSSDNGRSHAPIPFYVSSRGYGVLVDAARYITVYAGTGLRVDSKNPPVLYNRNTDKNWDAQPYSDVVEMLVPAEGATIYVFGGPTTMNAVQRYNLLNGGGYLPPKWGLGFTQRVPTLFSQSDIINEAKLFQEHQFPLDFIGVEPGWHSMSYPCTFEWDKGRFPRPKAFIDTLAGMGIRTNLWLNPYVAPGSALFPKVKPLSGSHTVWNGIVPDITLAETRQFYKEHFVKNHLDIGVGGYKVDEVDGYDSWLWPDIATYPSGTSAEQMRQVYGLIFQDMTAGWFKEKNQRTYGLVRGSNAGSSNLPYVIYNDYYSHRDFITALVNSSFIGVLWTPEVRASKTAEEWIRRMQSVCFSPMAMLNAWADGTRPWTFPEVADAVKDVATLRMQLLPYIYSTFAQYHFEGKPPVRAMNLVEGFAFKSTDAAGKFDATENPYAMAIRDDIKDQYMMGDNILVAPVFEGERSRKVYLPAGKWYDFYTGKFVGENQQVTIETPLERIPLFVRDGGIIPMVPVSLHAPGPGVKVPVEIRHYGNAISEFTLYDDDGLTFNYQKGAYIQVKLSASKDKKGKWIGKVSTRDNPYSFNNFTWKFMPVE